jgi:pimeloyl-ACP methyl ester carboxylesterase
MQERFITVDGIRTHYITAGSGPTVVLLHSGEFGGAAVLSWSQLIPVLADRYRVIAPDWLGYGETDKIHDFTGGQQRRMAHMTRFLGEMDITGAAFVGTSMGGTLIAWAAAEDPPRWPIRAMVLASGGGFAPDNEHRRAMLNYDCTMEGMRTIVGAMFHSPKFPADDEFVRLRYESSLVPGAWECAAAARFKSPVTPPRSDFGQPDRTVYEAITVPTLIVAGADDVLRLPGYADELHERIPDSRLRVYERCGHAPNLEHADRFNADVLQFLDEVYASSPVTFKDAES